MSKDINNCLFITHTYTWPAINKSHWRLKTEKCIRPELCEHGACWLFLTRYRDIKFSFIKVKVFWFQSEILLRNHKCCKICCTFVKEIILKKSPSIQTNKMIHMHLLNESFKAAAATLISFMQTAVSIRATSYSEWWAIFLFKTENSQKNVWKLKKKKKKRKRLHFKLKIDLRHIFGGISNGTT